MTQQNIIDLISSPGEQDALQAYLARLGFADPKSAARALQRIPGAAAIAPHLLAALSTAGDPDRVLAAFERFMHSTHSGTEPSTLATFLAARPRAVEMLVRIFSGSQFLAEILLRDPEKIETLVDVRRLAQPKSAEQLYSEARSAIACCDSPADQLDALRRYQRGELLRIGTCDLLDLFDLPTATLQLANLADSLVQVCLEVCAAQLNMPWKGFTVIGMGKLGGQELNYSSDIDFLFLASGTSPALTRLGERLVDALARVTTEGFLYRVDMRLRPWGKVGPLVSSPEGFIGYLTKHALLWEKQALLKARVVAGDQAVGQGFLKRAHPLLFGGAVETVRADVFAMKQRTEAFLEQKGRAWGDVKLGEGSIRDVEFVVQFLQLAHGERRPEILSHNTLESLARCREAALLNLSEYRVLSSGYIFLRTIEHHLQMLDYRQTHTLPDDPEAILSLARRLGFDGKQPGERFLQRYQQHAAAIRAIYLRYVGRIEMDHQGNEDHQSPSGKPGANASRVTGGDPAQLVDKHLSRMSPSYAERFSEEEIARHAALAGQLNDQRLVMVDARPLDKKGARETAWEAAIIAFDFPGELSLLCGLMFVYGLDIFKGDAFTYEAAPAAPSAAASTAPSAAPAATSATPAATSAAAPPPPRAVRAARRLVKPDDADTRRKIVDVFTVRPVRGVTITQETWLNYARELEELLQLMRAGQRREARGALAKRVGATLYEANKTAPVDVSNRLFPISIEIDNDSSEAYTVLHIDTQDTVGFLYEFTNALAIDRIYIDQVLVSSVGSQVRDTLFVTDENGQKLTNPERQRELRAATVLIKHFTHLLPLSPNPESALLHFREFIGQLFKRPNWPDELGSLERPEVLQALARLLGVSDFLWDDFLRMQYANLYPVVTDVESLAAPKSCRQLQAELNELLKTVHAGPQPPAEDAPWIETLNAFKDREMFRIDMRHILGYTGEFWDFAAELTDLAEVVVNTVYHLCHEDLRLVYGSPCLENGEVSEMSVVALGKCGGRELGFASDIELMFIYSGNGKTSGPQVISTTEFYEKLVQNFVRAVRARREGVFEIDLQLRPYGKAGSLSVSLDAFRRYFAPGGPAWAYERQALVKLRPVAGNAGLGQQITELRDAFVYTGEPFDVTAMRAMRERQTRHLVTGGVFNLKYSPGGLVDIEYLVQALQMTHGPRLPALRQPNTREAMAALHAAGILSNDDYTRLRKAHTFLRWLIDSLRVVRGNAKDVNVPAEGSEEFAFLARRMQDGNDTARLREDLLHFTADVQEINTRLLSKSV